MRARYTIGHRRYQEGAEDDFGQPVKSWAPAVDLKVYSIAPMSATPEPVPGRDAVVTHLSVLVPAGADLGPHDRFVIDGEEWEQDGEVGDYTRSPFPRRDAGRVHRGLRLALKRAEG